MKILSLLVLSVVTAGFANAGNAKQIQCHVYWFSGENRHGFTKGYVSDRTHTITEREKDTGNKVEVIAIDPRELSTWSTRFAGEKKEGYFDFQISINNDQGTYSIIFSQYSDGGKLRNASEPTEGQIRTRHADFVIDLPEAKNAMRGQVSCNYYEFDNS